MIVKNCVIELFNVVIVGGGSGAQEVVLSRATRRTVESVKTTEQLMESIDFVTKVWQEQQDYKEALNTWIHLKNEFQQNDENQSTSLDKLQPTSKPTPPAARLELNGLTPHRYLFNALTTITTPIMYEVVIALPFSFAEKVRHIEKASIAPKNVNVKK